jgi:hypothetical protein
MMTFPQFSCRVFLLFLPDRLRVEQYKSQNMKEWSYEIDYEVLA